MRVLVVDDSRATRTVIKRMLEGRDVVEASSAEEAIGELQRGEAFDLVLVDWHMPKMTGLELVKLLRGDADFDGVRLMMVTSEVDARSVVRALQAGVDEYIMKPFTRDGLLDKIALLGFADAR